MSSYLANGQYDFDRIWIAEEQGEIVARAVWWGVGPRPIALDCIYVADSVADRVGLVGELLAAAIAGFRSDGPGETPAYHVFLPSSWRDDPNGPSTSG